MVQISQAEWIFCGPKGISKLIAKLPCDTVVKQVSNLPKVTLLTNAGPDRRGPSQEAFPSLHTWPLISPSGEAYKVTWHQSGSGQPAAVNARTGMQSLTHRLALLLSGLP